MTKSELVKFRTRLQQLATRVRATADSTEELARQGLGGAAGDLSNAPMHLGDVGSEMAAQELGAALLENELYLQQEIGAALERIENGTFGTCENCGRKIAVARLAAIPYARYCVGCATALQAGRAVNINEGRPASWEEGAGLRAAGPPAGAPGGPREKEEADDTHAAGTPGGGTAVGGLAGTNIGSGAPDGADLENAMGSGAFDVAIEGEHPAEREAEEEAAGGYSGHTGGAVGGTPANKRTTGGTR